MAFLLLPFFLPFLPIDFEFSQTTIAGVSTAITPHFKQGHETL